MNQPTDETGGPMSDEEILLLAIDLGVDLQGDGDKWIVLARALLAKEGERAYKMVNSLDAAGEPGSTVRGGPMNHRERMALDEHIAGGHYSKQVVRLRCDDPTGECEWVGGGTYWSEYGTSGTDPEECPICQSPVEVIEA